MGIQALILAAGKGSRVNPKAHGTPKPLLEVGRRPLVDHMLEALADAGVGPVALVLGFCADEIREVVGIRAEYIHNPRWSATNSLYSFSLARSWVTGPVMIFNCDLLLHPEIIDRLLAAGEDSIAYDSSTGCGREQMVDKFRDGFLIDMGKDLPHDADAGENVGVVYLAADTARALFDKADRILAADGEKEWLGTALRELAREKRIRGVDVTGLPWVEIDFPYDLERARKIVWPSIQGISRKRRKLVRALRVFFVVTALLLISAVIRKGLFPPEYPEVSTLELSGAEQVELTIGDRQQKWWSLEENQSVTTKLIGPGTLKIDTRLLLNLDAPDKAPYVIEIRLDGKLVDLVKLETIPSKTAKYKDWIVGKRQRTKLDLPPGRHTTSVRLVAADGTRCLIRAREVEKEPPD